MLIPLMSEFLDYQQGDTERRKQDCETKAFHRLAARIKEAFPRRIHLSHALLRPRDCPRPRPIRRLTPRLFPSLGILALSNLLVRHRWMPYRRECGTRMANHMARWETDPREGNGTPRRPPEGHSPGMACRNPCRGGDLAERAGFEPAWGCNPLPDFESGPL
jgi:hypothetical protein